MNAIELLESGEYSDVNVSFNNEIYHLHKFPLLLKMGCARDKFKTGNDIIMPYLEGGTDIFTDVIAFCYGKMIEINPRNVAFLSNAAHIYEMFGKQNLIDLTDEYIRILISDLRISRKFGPAIVALAYAASLQNYEYCDIFKKLLNTILSMWIRRSHYNDEQLTFDPVLTEFLVFLPDNVNLRIIQEISTMAFPNNAAAELTAKFFALQFSLEASLRDANGDFDREYEDENDSQVHKNDSIITNHLKKAVVCTCLPFEKLSSIDCDFLTEELSGMTFRTTPLNKVMDNVFSALPRDIPLTSKINVDWCKQALAVTECHRETFVSRPVILEIAGKMLGRFSVEELRAISPQTIKDILATMNLNDSRLTVASSKDTISPSTTVTGDERKNGAIAATGGPQLRLEKPSSIAESLDLYFDAAIESQNMNIEDYISLLKTALPLDRRDNHDGLIRAICKLVKLNNEALTDDLREEILGVLDLYRCSAEALQEALDTNILPARAVAEAALRFAKRNSNATGNAVIVRERCQSPSPTRYSASTSSIYRTSKYMTPYQYHTASAYYPIASSTSTGYLLSSPLRQRRRPWERSIYGFDDKLQAICRHRDINGDYVVAKADNEGVPWNENSSNTTSTYRTSEY